MTKYLLYGIIILYAINTSAQDSLTEYNDDDKFITHLFENNLHNDVIYLLSGNNDLLKHKFCEDSLNYFLGTAYYNLKQTDSASYYYGKVSNKSELFNKSMFYSAFNHTAGKDYEAGMSALNSLDLSDSDLLEFKYYQMSSIALLKRDIEGFDSLKNAYSFKYFPLVEHEKNLMDHYQRITNFKKRSPVLAGLFSSIVPGLGKVYVGRYGEGAAAFLMVTAMGLVTYENYDKDGLWNYKTLIFGSVFSVYYIGNIWGSVFSVKFRRDEFNDEINHQIMLDVHIPLRRIFE